MDTLLEDLKKLSSALDESENELKQTLREKYDSLTAQVTKKGDDIKNLVEIRVLCDKLGISVKSFISTGLWDNFGFIFDKNSYIGIADRRDVTETGIDDLGEGIYVDGNGNIINNAGFNLKGMSKFQAQVSALETFLTAFDAFSKLFRDYVQSQVDEIKKKI